MKRKFRANVNASETIRCDFELADGVTFRRWKHGLVTVGIRRGADPRAAASLPATIATLPHESLYKLKHTIKQAGEVGSCFLLHRDSKSYSR